MTIIAPRRDVCSCLSSAVPLRQSSFSGLYCMAVCGGTSSIAGFLPPLGRTTVLSQCLSLRAFEAGTSFFLKTAQILCYDWPGVAKTAKSRCHRAATLTSIWTILLPLLHPAWWSPPMHAPLRTPLRSSAANLVLSSLPGLGFLRLLPLTRSSGLKHDQLVSGTPCLKLCFKHFQTVPIQGQCNGPMKCVLNVLHAGNILSYPCVIHTSIGLVRVPAVVVFEFAISNLKDTSGKLPKEEAVVAHHQCSSLCAM